MLVSLELLWLGGKGGTRREKELGVHVTGCLHEPSRPPLNEMFSSLGFFPLTKPPGLVGEVGGGFAGIFLLALQHFKFISLAFSVPAVLWALLWSELRLPGLGSRHHQGQALYGSSWPLAW